jgi:hypothetical protein
MSPKNAERFFSFACNHLTEYFNKRSGFTDLMALEKYRAVIQKMFMEGTSSRRMTRIGP